LLIWAGEGVDGLSKWYAIPESDRDLWWEHFINTHTGAYDEKGNGVGAALGVLRAEEQALRRMQNG
jgi:hypothetical protein